MKIVFNNLDKLDKFISKYNNLPESNPNYGESATIKPRTGDYVYTDGTFSTERDENKEIKGVALWVTDDRIITLWPDVPDEEMTDLTEKWRKGELEDGDYYIKTDDEIYPDYYDGGSGFIKTYDYVIEKILAPVPTYQEYLDSEAHCAVYSEENKRLKEENEILSVLSERLLCLEEEKWYNLVKKGTKEQQLDFLRNKEKYSFLALSNKYLELRQLLKECKEFFEEENPKDFTVISERMDDLLTRINAAIGESEE